MHKKRRIHAEAHHWPTLVGARAAPELLLQRETGTQHPHVWQNAVLLESFSSFDLQEDYNACACTEDVPSMPTYMRSPSKVLEIVAAGPYIFVLVSSGLCTVFDVASSQRFCYLNQGPQDVVRSIFHNKWGESLITVSCWAQDASATIRCTNTPLRSLCRGVFNTWGQPLLREEQLTYPGFIEFDGNSNRALVFNAPASVYHVYDLQQYSLLYAIPAVGVYEVKMSGQYLALLEEPKGEEMQLRVLSAPLGQVLATHQLPIADARQIHMLELFDDMLLLKLVFEPLKIFKVLSLKCTAICLHQSLNPTSGFVHLPEQHMFLTLASHTVTTWDFQGRQVTSFEDHELWYPFEHDELFYLAGRLGLIISYCRPARSGSQLPDVGLVGAIHVSHVASGTCLLRLTAPRVSPGSPEGSTEAGQEAAGAKQGRRYGRGAAYESAAAAEARHLALSDCCAIFYDEDSHVIYTGNRNGLVHAWSISRPVALTAAAG